MTDASNAQRFGRWLASTKLYWGLLLVLAAGALMSPIDAHGGNIFLSAANLTDVLRQVSITGIVAVGMTLVILIGGIDLSVGSVMAFGSTLTAMLLTQRGWHRGAVAGVPASAVAVAAIAFWGADRCLRGTSLPPLVRRLGALLVALAAGASMGGWLSAQLPGGVGIAGVIVAALALGLLLGAANGWVIAAGGLQPFIATLAMMVATLGAARLTAGPDQSVYPVYTSVNAPVAVDALRQSVLGVPFPGLVFLAVAAICAILLHQFRTGRQIYAIGGNERAAHLAGVPVARVKILVYGLCGMLACLASVLYVAQYRQGKPDAGTGLELDAIAACVIGGASLTGGRGTIHGTVVGVLIFGFLTNLFQLNNIDSNTQLVLKGLLIVVAVWLQEGRSLNLRNFKWGPR